MIFKSHRRMKNTTLSRMILAVWSSAIRESKTRLLYIEKAEALKAQYNRSCWKFQKSFPHWDYSTVFWRMRWRIWFHCNIYLHFYLSYQKSLLPSWTKCGLPWYSNQKSPSHHLQSMVHFNILFWLRIWSLFVSRLACQWWNAEICLSSYLSIFAVSKIAFHHIYQSLLFRKQLLLYQTICLLSINAHSFSQLAASSTYCSIDKFFYFVNFALVTLRYLTRCTVDIADCDWHGILRRGMLSVERPRLRG